MKRSKALCVGSIAYDIVFKVHNTLKDEIIIKHGKVGSVSMMLTAQNKKVFYGGTAGNISYGLGIQEEKPLLFSVVGGDFNKDYREHLESTGVDIRAIVKPSEYTATFYAISDAIKDQVGIFQPNTHGDYMDKISLADSLNQNDFDSIKVAIFSPGTGLSIKKHMEELRENAGMDPIVIFDPSQVLSIFFDEKLTKECIELSNIFIGNETEVDQLQNLSGLKIQDILDMGLQYVIETKGAEGCDIYSQSGKIHVEAKEAKKFVEQTGAGDAFRAGLMKGIIAGLSIEDSCKIGAEMGALNVEEEGGQNYFVNFDIISDY